MLERLAELLAYKREYPVPLHDKLFERLGVNPSELDAALGYWARSFAEGFARGDVDSLLRFAKVYAKVERQVRQFRIPIGELRPDPRLADTKSPSFPKVSMKPLEKSKRASEPAASAVREHLPTYLRDEARLSGPAEGSAAESEPPVVTKLVSAPLVAPPPSPPASTGDETVIGGAPSPKAMPFEGRLREPPPASPLQPSPDAGATVMAPLPEAVRAAVARLLEPVTAAKDGDDSSPAASPPLSLRDYAALRAALSVHGEESPVVLARFGLTAEGKRLLQERYFELFRTEPAVRERFEALLREEMSKLNAARP